MWKKAIRVLLGPMVFSAGCNAPRRDAETATRIARVSESRLRQHVRALADMGPRGLSQDIRTARRTVEYLIAELGEYGYSAEQEPSGVSIRKGEETHHLTNILAELRGAEEPSRLIEVGAHYDTVEGTPGADDNASGVAAVLEAARILAGSRCRRGIRFCFFCLEESGREGSRVHVQNLLRDPQRTVEGALVLEMVGYATDRKDSQWTPVRIPFLLSPPRTGDFIAVVGNFRSGGLGNRFESAAERYVPSLRYYSANRIGGWLADALRSDHAPYWEAGRKAIMITDTANFRNPHYHQPTDLPDTLDYVFLRRVAMAAAATLLDLAGPAGSGTSTLEHQPGSLDSGE
jgi:peptidase M28-like protein